MGDTFKKVTVRGVGVDGYSERGITVYALLDTGASAGVISSALAERCQGDVVPKFDTVEGKKRDVMLAKVKVHAQDCGERGLNLIVDDDLVERAGIGPDKKPVQMILGHDYMQRTRMMILLSENPDDAGVACRRGRTPKRRFKK